MGYPPALPLTDRHSPTSPIYGRRGAHVTAFNILSATLTKGGVVDSGFTDSVPSVPASVDITGVTKFDYWLPQVLTFSLAGSATRVQFEITGDLSGKKVKSLVTLNGGGSVKRYGEWDYLTKVRALDDPGGALTIAAGNAWCSGARQMLGVTAGTVKYRLVGEVFFKEYSIAAGEKLPGLVEEIAAVPATDLEVQF